MYGKIEIESTMNSMIKPILKDSDILLHTKCEYVSNHDNNLLELCNDLKDTLTTFNGLSLAANQIGSNKRVLVMMVNGFLETMVNPSLTKLLGEEKEFTEGCLSYPNELYTLKRNNKIKVKYLTVNGYFKNLTLSDLEAVCFQHELDHLDGITIIDKKIKV